MALENLENVFQDVSPQNSDIEKNIATKKPVEIEPEFDSVFDDLIKLKRIDIKDPDSPQTKQPSIEITDERTKKRQEELFQNIGQNNQLGLNDLILEKLYNVNHTAVELGDREPIDIGKFDENGNPILINTLRSGMGDLTKLDIRGYSSRFRRGLIKGEPYVVNSIGETPFFGGPVGYNRDLRPIEAFAESFDRIFEFYTSPAGLALVAKENTVNLLIGSSPNNNPLVQSADARVRSRVPKIKLNTLNKVLSPAVEAMSPLVGFLIERGFEDLGPQIASSRKPFEIEYSRRPSLSLPFGFLGDNVKKFTFTNLEGEEEAIRSPVEHPVLKKPRYLGLGSDGISNDKIAVSKIQKPLSDNVPPIGIASDPPIETLLPDLAIERGDFYVRIRDLRDDNYIYFRGYVTGITENVNPSFTSTNYIGRSEPVYLYERGDRDISFNLKVYPANIEQQDRMYEKLERLTSLAYPAYLPEDEENNSLVRMKAPFTEFYMAHIGSKAKGQFGFIKSISYTVNESGDWDALDAIPRLFDIAIGYQILHRKPPSIKTKFYGTTVGYNSNE